MKKWTINKLKILKKIKYEAERKFTKRLFSRFDSLTGAYSEGTFFFDYKNKLLMNFNYFLDLDNFKQVNEKFGPIAASKCLADYIRQLHHMMGDRRFKIYRLGGDEFIISCSEEIELKNLQKKLSTSHNGEKVYISGTAARFKIRFHDKINLENELAQSHFNVKSIKKRKKVYDLSVG